MMFCTKCGKQVPDHNTFCPYCGTPLNQNGGNGVTPENGQSAGNIPGKKPDDDNGSLLALALALSAAGFFVALILVIIGAVFFLRKHPISSWPKLSFGKEKAAVEETLSETAAYETEVLQETETLDPNAAGSIVITVKDANIHESPLENIQVKVFDAKAYPGQV
ncbi:MAG: zinc-ribbon domain-containing protein, partial [Lachnospiraceae bacterium]|nr:zinc-ribbon domain-containing protein [Lachnospiraceae bacterium]